MKKYHDRFTNKNKNKNSIFIGSTTSIILALDHGVEAVHVCEQPLFDSYNNGIWEPIRAKQLSENVLIYNMKKNRQILQIRSQHDSIKRYLD